MPLMIGSFTGSSGGGGGATVPSTTVAGRTVTTFADGTPIQAFLGAKSIALMSPVPNGNTMGTLGINATAQGTATARAPASTNLFTSTKRVGYVSGTVAGNVAGVRGATAYLWRGNAAGLGGFHAVWRFGWSDAVLISAAKGFVGLWSSNAVPTDVDPATLTNLIGVGCNNTANMQLYAAGAVAQPAVDLGVNFPAQTISTDLYELQLYAAPNAAAIGYRLTRLNTGHTAEGSITAAASLAVATTFLTPQAWRTNGNTAVAAGIDVAGFYSEAP